MNVETLLKLGSQFAIVMSLALNVYLFLRSRTDDRFDRINERAERMAKGMQDAIAERRQEFGKLERDHAVLAATVAGLPTHDDIGSIRDALSVLAKNVASVDQRSVTTLNSVHRIETYLLERKP